MCLTAATTIGAIVLGIIKFRNKQHGRDEDKFTKVMKEINSKIDDHTSSDETRHRDIDARLDRMCEATRTNGNAIAVLTERSQNEKELVEKLDNKLDEIRNLL